MRGKAAKLLRRKLEAELGRDPQEALFNIKGEVVEKNEERAYKNEYKHAKSNATKIA